jgi:hypothetical protein
MCQGYHVAYNNRATAEDTQNVQTNRHMQGWAARLVKALNVQPFPLALQGPGDGGPRTNMLHHHL